MSHGLPRSRRNWCCSAKIVRWKSLRIARTKTCTSRIWRNGARRRAAQLKGIKFDTSGLQLVRLDQQALEPLAAVKPKKALIIGLGGVAGLMLGVFAALLRPRQADKSYSHSSTPLTPHIHESRDFM
ncbi:GNVR domain-containing protein [Pseudomonas paeninsulae]|uniref:GNVR domain-containing protein n=1 Tax=Pseudomonas paeninsulae TaxID=3110772 RepID=UPI002D7892B8|nr:GNVR domain-containing protein [Pseudomonas sp. IT1137]